MNRTLILLTISLASLGLGYFLGTIKTMVDEKMDYVDQLVITLDTTETIESGKTKEDFYTFIDKFIADSVFQLDRIKFPLKSVRSDVEKVDSTFIKKSDWKITRLFGGEEYRPQIYDNFKREMRDTDERVFCWEGVENGINVGYDFSRIGGRWYLIEFNDFSN